MPRRVCGRFIMVIILLTVAAPAKADGWMDADLCQREVFGERDILLDDVAGDLIVAVRVCTQAIESGELSAPFLARSLRNRAIAFSAAGHYRQALVGFDESLSLNPIDAKTLTYRGFAAQKLGDVSSAWKDFHEALNFDPDQTLARTALEQLNWRPAYLGVAQSLDAVLERSVEHLGARALEMVRRQVLDRATEIDFFLRTHLRLDSPYAGLWLYLASERDGIDVQPKMRDYLARLGPDEWPTPLFQMYLGDIDVATAARLARDASTRQGRQRLCDVQFYHAELLWFRDVAKGVLSEPTIQETRKVANSCPSPSIESDIATVHLNLWRRWAHLSEAR